MQNLAVNFLESLQAKSQKMTEEILVKAKDCLFDYLTVTEAGAAANDKRWQNYCKNVPLGKVSVLGTDVMTDGKTACIINGYNAHSLELDDGQRFAMIHLGAAIITALHSAALEYSISSEQFLKGIVMGYEAACRVALAIQPSHKKKGFHAAGTCGTIGAAIGVAYALDMNLSQMKTILSVAVASSAGMLEIQEQGSELKPYNLGRAAMDGLAAAYMGFTDFGTPDDILGGERGFLALFSDDSNPVKAIEEQNYFEIERIYVKPYAACRHCHSAIEAALSVRDKIDINAIKEIHVETYSLAVKGHDHTQILGEMSAKLSIPYSVAVALILGKADVSAFDNENIEREDILNLTKKVRVAENPEFSANSSQKRIAKILLYMEDGAILGKQIDYAKGDPENPMTRENLKEKAVALLGENRAKQLIDLVYNMYGSNVYCYEFSRKNCSKRKE